MDGCLLRVYLKKTAEWIVIKFVLNIEYNQEEDISQVFFNPRKVAGKSTVINI